MNQYRKGATFERKLKRKLETEGKGVIRAAGSHGPFDLVASDHDSVVFIQVKSGNAIPTSDELVAMRSFPVPLFARKAVYRKRDWAREWEVTYL